MTIRDVITQLLKYPLDAPLFVMQGDALNPACATEFTVSGPVILNGEEVNIDQPQVGFVICSEAEFVAAQQAQAEAEKVKEEPEEAVFEIGQIFEEACPPEAAMWCKKNLAYIKEIEPVTREEEVWFETPAAYDDEGNEIPYSASSWTETIENEVRRFQIVAAPEPTQEEAETE